MPVIVRPEPEPEEEPRGPAEPEPLVEPELDDAGVLVAVARLNTFTNLSVSVEHYCRRFGAPSDAELTTQILTWSRSALVRARRYQ